MQGEPADAADEFKDWLTPLDAVVVACRAFGEENGAKALLASGAGD